MEDIDFSFGTLVNKKHFSFRRMRKLGNDWLGRRQNLTVFLFAKKIIFLTLTLAWKTEIHVTKSELMGLQLTEVDFFFEILPILILFTVERHSDIYWKPEPSWKSIFSMSFPQDRKDADMYIFHFHFSNTFVWFPYVNHKNLVFLIPKITQFFQLSMPNVNFFVFHIFPTKF